MAYRNYAPANGFHVNANGTADFTSVNSAIAAATAGQTVYLHGTVTENVTLKAGVDIVSWPGEGLTPNATIIGTCTFTAAGTVSISGIRLQTNSANFLAVGGSSASIVNLTNCYLNSTNNTGISFTTANTSARLNLLYCRGDIATTGISLYTDTSTGTLDIQYSDVRNSGNSTTLSSTSSGLVAIRQSNIEFGLSTTSTGSMNLIGSRINTSNINTIGVTWNGTGGGTCTTTFFTSGSASSISIGTGVACAVYESIIGSTNTNSITGAGSIAYSGLSFSNSSSTINTTTQNIAGTLQGNKTVAPTAGFLGEQFRSYNPGGGSAVSLTNGIAANITSISPTAGIWDVSGVVNFGATTVTGTNFVCSVNTTSATVGSTGDNSTVSPIGPSTVSGMSLDVPAYRVTLTSTTTIYLVAQANFSAGSISAFGRISATRVG